MKRPGNVLPFPSDHSSDFSLKLFAVIFYLFLAFFLTFITGLSSGGITALVIFFILYNFLVRQQVSKAHYFRDNRIFLGILLVVFLIIFKGTMLLLLMMAAIYWLLVGKKGREAPYFLKFHLATALIVNFFLLMPFLLFQAILELVKSVFILVKLEPLIRPVLVIVGPVSTYVLMGLFFCVALWLAISAFMGRTPFIPVVTDNVRHWA